ncbi:ESX secretion-associated protein EspG [Kibdelosporangium persicum]|uniref:ESX secretion-associated protein EspG n=1 Tax=Kibdelosporangium persicum TaxID=2698649 RepID=A0ABX2F4N7_9PSEU|nr:ESX secretion-associated protein EspG [Kibdelosporangium persicum]NRN66119.1 ESX secretion-associated protein EspG [Kibdelosporangium persicum]
MIHELSLPAIDTLWEDLRLGSVPFPLEVRSHGETLDERRRIKAAVYSDLENRGLARRQRPEPELEDALTLLARPTICIDNVAMLDMRDQKSLKAMVVATGRQAMLVVQRDLKISFTPVRETALAASIVDVLPHVKAGPGQPMTLPVDALSGGSHRRPDPEHRMHMQRLQAVMQRPVIRAGQFGITVRDRQGRPNRLPGLAWFDTDAGRYMNVVRESWLTLTPADSGRIVHRLSEDLLRALQN